MVGGDGEGGLEVCGGFDHGGDEAGGDVPFDVAVEEPDAGVVCSKSQDDVAVWRGHKGISFHGDTWECLVAGPISGILL